MPKLGKLNLAEIKPPASLPAGKHVAKLTDCEGGLSRKGDDMWTWTWTLSGGEHDGRTIKSYTMVGPKANLLNLKNHLEAFGITGEINGVDTDKLIGKLVILVITKGTRPDSNDPNVKIETSNVNGLLPYKKRTPAPEPVAEDTEDGDDTDTDTEEAPTEPQAVVETKKGKGKKAEPEPEPEDDGDDDDLPNLD